MSANVNDPLARRTAALERYMELAREVEASIDDYAQTRRDARCIHIYPQSAKDFRILRNALCLLMDDPFGVEGTSADNFRSYRRTGLCIELHEPPLPSAAGRGGVVGADGNWNNLGEFNLDVLAKIMEGLGASGELSRFGYRGFVFGERKGFEAALLVLKVLLPRDGGSGGQILHPDDLNADVYYLGTRIHIKLQLSETAPRGGHGGAGHPGASASRTEPGTGWAAPRDAGSPFDELRDQLSRMAQKRGASAVAELPVNAVRVSRGDVLVVEMGDGHSGPAGRSAYEASLKEKFPDMEIVVLPHGTRLNVVTPPAAEGNTD